MPHPSQLTARSTSVGHGCSWPSAAERVDASSDQARPESSIRRSGESSGRRVIAVWITAAGASEVEATAAMDTFIHEPPSSSCLVCQADFHTHDVMLSPMGA